MKKQFALILPAMLWSIFLSTQNLQAGEMYIGAGGAFNHIASAGDFDGRHFLYGSSDLWDIPQPSPDSGGFLVRMGGSQGSFGMDMQYARQSHNLAKSAFYDPPQGKTMIYNFVDVNLRFIVPVELVDLYALCGLNYSSLEVEKGRMLPNYSLANETFTGVAGNLGIGADYYFAPAFSVFAEYVYRFLSYFDVNEKEIEEPLNGGGMHTLQIGIKYHIPVSF